MAGCARAGAGLFRSGRLLTVPVMQTSGEAAEGRERPLGGGAARARGRAGAHRRLLATRRGAGWPSGSRRSTRATSFTTAGRGSSRPGTATRGSCSATTCTPTALSGSPSRETCAWLPTSPRSSRCAPSPRGGRAGPSGAGRRRLGGDARVPRPGRSGARRRRAELRDRGEPGALADVAVAAAGADAVEDALVRHAERAAAGH